MRTCEKCGKRCKPDEITFEPVKNNRICFECLDKIEKIVSTIEGEYYENYNTFWGEEMRRVEKKTLRLKPHQIKEKLDEYVIGQEIAKRDLSVALFNHKRKIETNNYNNKSNILIVGPTGCGKTHLVKSICKIMDIPYTIQDATSLTAAGYVGKDITSILYDLVSKCKGNKKKAEGGLIYIDEIDKVAKKMQFTGDGKDIGGESVQQGLLKMVEGEEVSIDSKAGNFTMNTSKILFIFSGSFLGLSDIVKNRSQGEKSIGFNSQVGSQKFTAKDFKKKLDIEDIISYGMIPEFVGRVPLLTVVEPLEEEGLIDILLNAKNSLIREYQNIFSLEDTKLTFTHGAIKLIAKIAKQRGTGARGLNSIVEKLMVDIIYYMEEQGVEDNKVIVEVKNIKKVLDI